MKVFIRSEQRNFYFIIKSFIKIVDSITPLVSFGFFWTDFEYKFTKWFVFKK